MADTTVETAIYRLKVEGQAEIDRLTKSIDGMAVAEEKATAANRTFSQSLQNNIARLDPLVKAQEQYRKALETNARYRESGVGTEQQLNAQLDAATQKYQSQISVLQQGEKAVTALAEAHKGLNAQGQAAFHSLRSMVEVIAMGGSPVQALTQQMNHLTFAASGEGGIVGAFKQVGSLLAGLATPMMATVAGLGAIAAAAAAAAIQLDKVQVSSQRAISGAGARTGTTVSDINAFVGQNSGVGGTGLSEKEARGLAEDLTRTGDIVISKLHGMSDAVVGFSNQTGKSVDEAIKAFAKMGQDPVKAMDELAKTYGEFDEHTRNTVETLALASDKTAAFQVVLDALSEKSKEAAQNMGFFEKVTRGVVNLLATEAVKPSGLEAQLENARKKLNTAIESAPDMLNTAEASENVARLSREFENLQAKIEQVNVAKITAQLNAANTEAARHNEYVAAIARSWGDVSPATAKVLNDLQQQVTLASAVTEQEKMAAQAAIDFAQASEQGKTAIEAEAIAAAKLQVSQAAANASVEKQIQSLNDSTKLINAQAKGMGDAAERSIAYDNAIKSGASETQAAALSAAMLSNQMAKAAGSAQSWASIMGQNFNAGMSALLPQGTGGLAGYVADYSPYAANRGTFEPDIMTKGLQGSISTDPMANTVDISYRGGGGGKRIGGFGSMAPGAGVAAAEIAAQQKAREEFAQTEQEKLKKITDDSTKAMEDLMKSVDQNTAATKSNTEMLSPFYSQDPRTSHIGFRSQGMAAGGYVDVPGGISSNDNMLATIPVASGERIYVDPTGGGRRGGGGGIVVNISSPVTINGNANVDQFARTLYQANQSAAKQVRAAMQ